MIIKNKKVHAFKRPLFVQLNWYYRFTTNVFFEDACSVENIANAFEAY